MFGKNRIHEPFAIAAIFSAAVTLHAAWMLNILFSRLPNASAYLTLSDRIGPITGMYTISGVLFLTIFGFTVIWLRGRDCSAYRDRVFWFFTAALVAFIILTHPIVYEFGIREING